MKTVFTVFLIVSIIVLLMAFPSLAVPSISQIADMFSRELEKASTMFINLLKWATGLALTFGLVKYIIMGK